jgi:hypothetical protein
VIGLAGLDRAAISARLAGDTAEVAA